MVASVGSLAQQALRLLGVRVVPLEDAPELTATVPFSDIANAALEELGVLNAGAVAAGLPPTGIVPQSEIATRSLIELGVLNSDETLTAPAVVTPEDVGIGALVELGVLNSADTLAPPTTIPYLDIVTAALDELGVLNSDIPPSTDVIAPDLIATTALVELGVIAADETPSTSDQALAYLKVDLVHESLARRGIAKWDRTAIPNAVAEEYVKLVAMESASSFGKAVDPSLIALLEGRIREVAIVMTGSFEFMTGQLITVHESLVAKGIAQWDRDAVPAAFYSEYVKLMVAMASATFGKQTDPAVIAMLEDRIRTGATVLHNSRTYMSSHVEAVHASLQAQGIALWNITAIPQAFAEEYVKLTAANAALDFGKPAADPAFIALLEDRVRKGAIVLNNNQQFMLEQVSFVHASLQGHGIASWSINAIPQAVAEDYIKLTAAYSGASFGKPVDPALIAMLEDDARKSALVVTVDQAFMYNKVEYIHAALNAQGVVWWAPGEVPRAFAEEYVKLTAATVAPMFGKPVDPAFVALLEARVRKGVMVLISDDVARQAVQAVHDDLTMRGIARWTVFDIPDAVGTSYVTLAADAIGPAFEIRTNPNDARDAMITLYRYVALPTSGERVATAYF